MEKLYPFDFQNETSRNPPRFHRHDQRLNFFVGATPWIATLRPYLEHQTGVLHMLCVVDFTIMSVFDGFGMFLTCQTYPERSYRISNIQTSSFSWSSAWRVETVQWNDTCIHVLAVLLGTHVLSVKCTYQIGLWALNLGFWRSKF